jgi:23S rRNA (uridine2552-2'-O)-methyltransferase
MARSKSSNRWLNEHVNDDFVKRAQADAYRSRAVYKLMELNEKDGLLRPGMRVLELGASPGGWTQYVAERLQSSGVIVASDILPMDSIADVHFVQGDFREVEVADEIVAALGDAGADLVLSDMAPNLSGVSATDQARALYLAELARDMAADVLSESGNFLTKVFQGAGFDAFITSLRSDYKKVILRKPKASRPRSREVYAVALGRII